MKKLLLVSTAIAGVALMAAPASAAVKLDLGGYFRGYVLNSDDEGANLRETDLRRDAEVHVSGETTLDNGLTVGFHTEQALGGATTTDEVYAYFSGGWGRVNVGSEDGAAYLLQVGAPSADSNVDGMRVYMQGFGGNALDTLVFGTRAGGTVGAGETVNGTFGTGAGGSFGTTMEGELLDYDHAPFRQTDRLTYLTPKFNGFQAGVSYAWESGMNAVGNNVAAMAGDAATTAVYNFDTGETGAAITAGSTDYEDLWEAAARWDGEFQGFGLSAGVGYSSADIEGVGDVLGNGAFAAGEEGQTALSDGVETWNGGLAVSFQGFSLGGSYQRAETSYNGVVRDGNATGALMTGDIERDTWVVGGGWDNGPYHVGVSYLNQQTDIEGLSNDAGVAHADDFQYVGTENEVDKFTVGAGYTFGPGMTFRGSVAWGEYDIMDDDGAGAFTRTSNDFQQIAVGTDIQF